VSQFKYLVTTVTNQNLIQMEINRRLNFGNSWCHSVQNLRSSRLLSKNVKIRICKTIIVPVVLYGCESWSLTLREERRLRMFENRVLRYNVTEGWWQLRNEELHKLHSSPSTIGMTYLRKMRREWHVARMGRRRKHKAFWWESQKERATG
jgi:hypothetical protein